MRRWRGLSGPRSPLVSLIRLSPDAVWAAYLCPLLCRFGTGAVYICEATIVGSYWGRTCGMELLRKRGR